MIRLLLAMTLAVVALPAWAQDGAEFAVEPSAYSVDMSLAPTQVLVFGKPALGTPLMEKNPMIGLDLPLKVLVYRDVAGDVWLAYTKPEALVARRSGIAGEDERIEMMTKGLGATTDAAIGADG